MHTATLIANWKMNGDLAQLKAWCNAIEPSHQVDIKFCPPSCFLHSASNAIQEAAADITLGAQGVSQFASGAHTNQLSAQMVSDVGATFTLVGHSETRAALSLDNAAIQDKITCAVQAKLSVVLCIGEPTNLSDAEAKAFLEAQLSVLSACAVEGKAVLSQVSIAYEPIWAIGSGKVPTNAELKAKVQLIEAWCDSALNGQSLPILYGGSVNADNIAQLYEIPGISGFLVGGASLKASSMNQMAAALSAAAAN